MSKRFNLYFRYQRVHLKQLSSLSHDGKCARVQLNIEICTSIKSVFNSTYVSSLRLMDEPSYRPHFFEYLSFSRASFTLPGVARWTWSLGTYVECNRIVQSKINLFLLETDSLGFCWRRAASACSCCTGSLGLFLLETGSPACSCWRRAASACSCWSGRPRLVPVGDGRLRLVPVGDGRPRLVPVES